MIFKIGQVIVWYVQARRHVGKAYYMNREYNKFRCVKDEFGC